MIHLVVEDYCQNGCEAFEPETVKYSSYDEKAGRKKVTIWIRCEKRNLCEQLLNHLKKQQKEEKDE